MVIELHVSKEPVPSVVQVRHSEKTLKPMVKKKDHVPTNKLNKPVPPPNPKDRKPVIAFYRNSAKSKWVLFPQICLNEKTAKLKVHTMTGSNMVSCIDVPKELQD